MCRPCVLSFVHLISFVQFSHILHLSSFRFFYPLHYSSLPPVRLSIRTHLTIILCFAFSSRLCVNRNSVPRTRLAVWKSEVSGATLRLATPSLPRRRLRPRRRKRRLENRRQREKKRKLPSLRKTFKSSLNLTNPPNHCRQALVR